jgi:hypothetical protein
MRTLATFGGCGSQCQRSNTIQVGNWHTRLGNWSIGVNGVCRRRRLAQTPLSTTNVHGILHFNPFRRSAIHTGRNHAVAEYNTYRKSGIGFIHVAMTRKMERRKSFMVVPDGSVVGRNAHDDDV